MPNTENEWQPIETAPKKTWVEVCGDSGVHSPEHFITLAIYDPEHRPLVPWRDMHLFSLSESGWTPLYWRPASPVPPMRSKNA